MSKVSLPGDAWAVLRDPETVTEGRRRPIIRLQRRILMRAGATETGLTRKQLTERLSPEDYDSLEDVDDMVMAALVSSWSYDADVTPEGLLELPGPARSALLKACRPLIPRLLGETTDEDVLNPESPTTPANDSDKP